MPRLSNTSLTVEAVKNARPPKSGYVEHADAEATQVAAILRSAYDNPGMW